ncbi:MAG: KAP family NTPase, partial [Nitrososphaera sp.]|nr:KAP family NTPase [Nitrososphaera sp.]
MKNYLNRLPIQIVVLIDELDRMHRHELDVLFKVVRGVTTFRNISYVCAFNSEAIARMYNKGEPSSEYGRQYLGKFFPIQLALPKIEESIPKDLFDKRLTNLARMYGAFGSDAEEKQFHESIRPLWESTIKHALNTFRKLNLFFSSLGGAASSVAKEVNFFDFVVLELIREIAPQVYEDIYSHGSYFFNPKWRIGSWLETIGTDEKVMRRQRGEFYDLLLNDLPWRTREQVKKLLIAIFPYVVEHVEGKGLVSISMGAETTVEKERRIYHPDFFPRYFIHRSPADSFGEVELAEFTSGLIATTDLKSGRQLFISKFAELRNNPSKRWDFLHRLIGSIDRIDDSRKRALASGVAVVSSEFEMDVLGFGEFGRGRAIVYEVAQQSAAPQDIFADVIANSTSDI